MCYFLTLKISRINWGSSEYLQTVSSWRAIWNGSIIRYVYSHEITPRNQLALDLVLSVSSNKQIGSNYGTILGQRISHFHIRILLSLTRNAGIFFASSLNAGQKTKFKDGKNRVTSYQQSRINDGHFTTNNDQRHTIQTKCECPTFILIDTKIRNLCSLKPDIPWRGLRGSLNCIQKRSWFHKWLVHTSKVKWGYFHLLILSILWMINKSLHNLTAQPEPD